MSSITYRYVHVWKDLLETHSLVVTLYHQHVSTSLQDHTRCTLHFCFQLQLKLIHVTLHHAVQTHYATMVFVLVCLIIKAIHTVAVGQNVC